jgi:hypothetical protein
MSSPRKNSVSPEKIDRPNIPMGQTEYIHQSGWVAWRLSVKMVPNPSLTDTCAAMTYFVERICRKRAVVKHVESLLSFVRTGISPD